MSANQPKCRTGCATVAEDRDVRERPDIADQILYGVEVHSRGIEMTDTRQMTGGCMCGAVRYQTTGEPFTVNHCHCRSCRKHNGAPVVTLAGFKSDQVVFSGAERKLYESSAGANRAFCVNCGTPITWEGDGDDLGPICEIHMQVICSFIVFSRSGASWRSSNSL